MNTMANTTLEEGELEQSICSVVEKSWYEECEQANHEMTVSFFPPIFSLSWIYFASEFQFLCVIFSSFQMELSTQFCLH